MNFPKITARHWRMIACAVITAAATLIAILCISTARAPADNQAAQQNVRLPRGSMLTLQTTYALCGHELSQQEVLVCEGRDVTRDELQALYPDWQLTEFSSDSALLVRTLDIPCEKHYLIKLSGARLTISQLRNGEMVEAGSAAIARDALDPELIQQLERGKLADTLAQAEGVIENVQS